MKEHYNRNLLYMLDMNFPGTGTHLAHKRRNETQQASFVSQEYHPES